MPGLWFRQAVVLTIGLTATALGCSAAPDSGNEEDPALQPGRVAPHCDGDSCLWSGLCTDNGYCSCTTPSSCTRYSGIPVDPGGVQCCIATSQADCERSLGCEKHGECYLCDGWCRREACQ